MLKNIFELNEGIKFYENKLEHIQYYRDKLYANLKEDAAASFRLRAGRDFTYVQFKTYLEKHPIKNDRLDEYDEQIKCYNTLINIFKEKIVELENQIIKEYNE